MCVNPVAQKFKMKILPLESNLNGQQKIHLSIFVLFCGYLASELLSYSLNTKGYLLLAVVIVVLILLLSLLISKKGLVAKQGAIYRGTFIGNTLILKQQIGLQQVAACSILKFKRRQKYPFFSSARPDLAYDFNAFDIYLLNERHTKKKRLLSLKIESNSKKAIDFLTENTNLNYEVYSPNFR